MTAHAADPFARDRAIRQHLDAVRDLMSETCSTEGPMRGLITEYLLADKFISQFRRADAPDDIRACADDVMMHATALSQALHDAADYAERG